MTSDELNQRWIAGYEEILQRIHILEKRSGLSAVGFGVMPQSDDSAERVDALCALAKWRIERLESLQNVN